MAATSRRHLLTLGQGEGTAHSHGASPPCSVAVTAPARFNGVISNPPNSTLSQGSSGGKRVAGEHGNSTRSVAGHFKDTGVAAGHDNPTGDAGEHDNLTRSAGGHYKDTRLLEAYSHGAAVSRCPPPLPEVGSESFRSRVGALALKKPAVGESRRAWMEALDSLSARGADADWVSEARGHIHDGVSLELSSVPSRSLSSNSQSVTKHLGLCKERVKVYEDLGAVVRDAAPKLVHPLLAIEKEGRKVRLCLDLSRNLNDFVRKRKFKLLSLRRAVELSTPGCFYGKMDLSACFLSFPLSPEASDLMGFELDGDSFRFTGVPFGLSSAPRVVSLLLDVVSSVLQEAGARHVRYLDDFLFIGDSAKEVRAAMVRAAEIFKKFGLVNNLDKYEGPSTRMEFLGILIDSVSQTLSLPDRKLEALQETLSDVLGRRVVSTKRLHSLLGIMAHLSSVLPAARPFMRRLIDVISFRKASKSKGPRRLGTPLREDLLFWHSHVRKWNGTQRWMASGRVLVMASDASVKGFGWVVEKASADVLPLLPTHMRPGHAVSGLWSGDLLEIQSSSENIAWGELYSPVKAAEQMGQALRGTHLVFVLDNSVDVEVINRRKTRSPRLLVLLRRLCQLSLEFGFAFTAVHRPGARNILPDVLSRPEKHLGKLDLTSLSDAVLREIAAKETPKSSPPPIKPFSYGAFFLVDPVSTAISSIPMLFPLSVYCVDSSLLDSEKWIAKSWEEQ